MATRFPGTTIEVSSIQKGSSKQLFDGLFAPGGITLSQVCVMTGLEPYLIQNWIKRGFVAPPKKRFYSKEQFSRIIIINMLREVLQIDHICQLLKIISGTLDDEGNGMVGEDELYHHYVDLLSDPDICVTDPQSVLLAVQRVSQGFEDRLPNGKKRLELILQSMLYAHASTNFRNTAEEILSKLD